MPISPNAISPQLLQQQGQIAAQGALMPLSVIQTALEGVQKASDEYKKRQSDLNDSNMKLAHLQSQLLPQGLMLSQPDGPHGEMHIGPAPKNMLPPGLLQAQQMHQAQMEHLQAETGAIPEHIALEKAKQAWLEGKTGASLPLDEEKAQSTANLLPPELRTPDVIAGLVGKSPKDALAFINKVQDRAQKEKLVNITEGGKTQREREREEGRNKRHQEYMDARVENEKATQDYHNRYLDFQQGKASKEEFLNATKVHLNTINGNIIDAYRRHKQATDDDEKARIEQEIAGYINQRNTTTQRVDSLGAVSQLRDSVLKGGKPKGQ